MKLNKNLQKLIDEKNEMGKQVTLGIEVITPEIARKYISKNLNKKNIKNRKIDIRTVNSYVNDILGDRWKLGAPIMFDVEENMIDGQTRCTAVFKANTPIVSLVVRGLPLDCFDAMDSGKKRTHKNVLETLIVNGYSLMKPAGVSAGINIMMAIERNFKSIDKSRGTLTNTAIYEMVKNDFDYFNSPYQLGKIVKWRKNINLALNESILAAFYYINKKNDSALDGFIDTITSNDENTPPVVREFRDMMLANKGKKSDERGYITPRQVYELINALYIYSQEKGGLKNRKHFSKTDLQKINE